MQKQTEVEAVAALDWVVAYFLTCMLLMVEHSKRRCKTVIMIKHTIRTKRTVTRPKVQDMHSKFTAHGISGKWPRLEELNCCLQPAY